MSDDRRPIGYWLKHLDRLLEQTFERTLEAEHLTRRHWQVLNTLIAGPTANRSLAAALEPFIGDNPTALNGVMNDLLRRGWVLEREDGDFELSAEGRSSHAVVMQKVAATRQLVRRGISDDDYVAVVAILQRMSSNLESNARE